jgi:hypothetical protein
MSLRSGFKAISVHVQPEGLLFKGLLLYNIAGGQCISGEMILHSMVHFYISGNFHKRYFDGNNECLLNYLLPGSLTFVPDIGYETRSS